ncbi:MAG: Cyclopropane-fatty-acyl-phospholipid synthase [Frankiales bacterium]|nr:Cyclopropane-fatty-acyl-phospholipid synthase [Frankiales bacterium]
MGKQGVAEALHEVLAHSVRVTAYDGSAGGPADAAVTVHVRDPRALTHLVLAPGQLGLARGYVAGLLDLEAPDHHAALDALSGPSHVGDLTWAQRLGVLRAVGPEALHLVEPPPQEVGARRYLTGLRSHGKARDALAIAHHYDVSNRFYSWVLGPSMAYTCACYPSPDATLDQAQEHKFDLVCRKLGLEPGMRLLDVGCGWGSLAVHAARNYGVQVVAVTLSRQQAEFGQKLAAEAGLADAVDVRHADYRDVTETGFDAIASIGLTEHIGIANLQAYAERLAGMLRPQGRLLNHSITRRDDDSPPIQKRGFITRYVFPDGEIPGLGRIISTLSRAGLEVTHEESLRQHYSRTCAAWSRNLDEHWEQAVAEVGLGTARVWALYLAGSRLGFERGELALHQVLAVKTEAGESGLPLRPDWGV